MTYIHQRDNWPAFRWSDEQLASRLGAVRHRQGRLIGRMEALGFQLREEAVLRTLIEDVIKSSEIEGEKLDRAQVRSSIARRLGMEIGGLVAADRDTEGVVEMMLDATQNHAAPLVEDRLFGWHAALFPTGRSGMSRITVGGWRDDSIRRSDAGRLRPDRSASASIMKRRAAARLSHRDAAPSCDGLRTPGDTSKAAARPARPASRTCGS